MGPLSHLKIVEFAGIGPGPMAAMLLADLGADVLRLERIQGPSIKLRSGILNRSRRSAALDLKQPDGVETALTLLENADALIEGFRPGVMERLGLGPDVCLARNPKLVYGRMTGWGQEGPLAQAAGHDINYIALTGALHAIGPKDGPPAPPLNLVGDFGGGALYLAFGLVSAILEATHSGKGQVLDVAMIDGAASLMTSIYGSRAMGVWKNARQSNQTDGGAHYYGAYETKDGKFISIASIEPQFYAELLDRLGLADEEMPAQLDRDDWPTMRERFEALFQTRTRNEWCELLEGTDVCFAPVLSMAEAPEHPHMKARGAFVEVGGTIQPAPAPRFSRTPAKVSCPPPQPGQDTVAALKSWGIPDEKVSRLLADGVIWQRH